MRVRVSYTVEFDSIPNEIANIVEGAAGQLSELSVQLSQMSSDLVREPVEKVLTSVENIDNVRQGLASLDMRLADCYDILSGFIEQKNRGQQIPEIEPQQKVEEPKDDSD
tara:strand:- start:37 stop:366 length:330 start_codon:yes stop_codon:yes gene_type:complete